MYLNLKYDASEDGRLLVFGLKKLSPDTVMDARKNIRWSKDSLIDEVIQMKKRLAEIVTQCADSTLTDAQRDALGREGDQLLKYLPELTVKRIFEEN